MYLEFFGLREKPFNVTPDPHFLYMSPSHQEAFANLIYGVRERKGFIMVTGEVGTGKTTLLHSLLANLDDDIRSVFVFHTGLDFTDMLEMVHHELGIPISTPTRAALLQSLNRYLIEQLGEGRNVALIIDEAQNLSPELLENLRLLSNLETAKDKLLQIVLVGQPELDDKMALPQLRQLKQRIAVHGVIDTLSPGESRAYIRHRLAVAGAPNQGAGIFSEEAISHLVHAAGGVPRQLNVLCDNALLIAYADGSREVLSAHAREAIRDHGAPTPSARRKAELEATQPSLPPLPPPAPSRRWLMPAVIIGALAIAALLYGSFRLGSRKGMPGETSRSLPPQREVQRTPQPMADEPAAAMPIPATAQAAPAESPAQLADELARRRDSAVLDPLYAGERATETRQAPTHTGERILDPMYTRQPDEAVTQRPAESVTQRPVAARPVETVAERPATSRPVPSATQLDTATQSSAPPAASDVMDEPPAARPATQTRTSPPATSTPAVAVTEDGRPGRFLPDRRPENESVPLPQEAPDSPVASPEPAPLTHHEGNQNLLERFWHASTLVELQSILDQCPRRTYVVRPGDHFIGLVYAATGRRDVLVLDLVERMNPQVTDFDLIEVGWPLILPDFTSSASETSEVAGTPSG